MRTNHPGGLDWGGLHLVEIGATVVTIMKIILVIFILLTFGKELRPLVDLAVNGLTKAVNSI